MKRYINKKNIIYLLVLLFVPLFLEFFISNIGIIINKESTKIYPVDINKLEVNGFDIENNQLISNKEKALFSYKINKQYIKKFQLNYHSMENVEYKITIDGYDENGQKVKRKKGYSHSKYTNLISKNLNMIVEKITIEVNKKDVHLENIRIDNRISFCKVRYLFILLLILSLIICINFYINKDKRLYLLYFIISLLAGISFILVEPNLATITWDEAIHYNSTNEILKGKYAEVKESDLLITDHSISLPSSDEERKNLSGAINNLDTVVTYKLVGTNIIPYSRYVYVPAAIVRNIFSIFKLKPTLLLKIGKLINLLLFIFMMSYAIKLSKIGKRTLFILGLIPTTIFQAISYSADSLIIAGITLSMVIFINLVVDKEEKVNLKNIFLFTIPLLAASFAKAVYCPLLLLLLFLPKSKFNSKKLCIQTRMIIIALFVLMMSTFGIGVLTNASSMGDVRGGHTNFSEQAHIIMNHPFTFIKVCSKNIIDTFTLLFKGDGFIFFAYLSGTKWQLSYILLFLLIFTIFTNYNSKEEEKYQISKFHKLLIFIVILGIIFGISLALYLSFTEVGKLKIEGVQSRYYLPLLYPMIALLFSTKIKSKYNENKLNLTISTITTIVIFLSIFELVICKIY